MDNGPVSIPSIRLFRLAKHVTQDKVAEAAGITRTAYQKIETGECIPKVSTLQGIARALGVKLQDLLDPIQVPQTARFRTTKRLNSRYAILLDVLKWLRNFTGLEEDLDDVADYHFARLAKDLEKMDPGNGRAVLAAQRARELLGLRPWEPIHDI